MLEVGLTANKLLTDDLATAVCVRREVVIVIMRYFADSQTMRLEANIARLTVPAAESAWSILDTPSIFALYSRTSCPCRSVRAER